MSSHSKLKSVLLLAQALALLFVLLTFSACQSNASSIAYLRLVDGYWEVWLKPASAGKDRQLTSFKSDVSRISWFPNGRELLINLHDGRLFRVNAENGEMTAVQAPMPGILDAVVSPDGKKATYSLSTAGSIDDNDIWVFDLATGRMEKLTSMPRLQHEPTWSRDGKSIYFLSGGGGQTHDVWRVDVASRKAEQLTVNAAYHFDLAMRSDGAMAYSGNRTGDYDLWLRHPDGRTEQLTKDADLDARPSWSPDGKELVFESSRGGVVNIWRLGLRSPEPQQLTEAAEGARQPVWAPAGDSL